MFDAHNRGNQVDMLKPSDLAPRLGVTTGRVYQLIAEGIIPSVRIGRGIRIPRDAWEEWLKEQSRRATEGLLPTTGPGATEHQEEVSRKGGARRSTNQP